MVEKVENKVEKGVFKLEVAKKSHDLALLIYKATATFPKSESYGLVSQIRRSITSIPANLADAIVANRQKSFDKALILQEARWLKLNTIFCFPKTWDILMIMII